MSEAKLANLREGDVIRVSYEVAVLSEPDEDGDVRIHEPGTGERGWLVERDLQTLEATVELVSRKGKFNVGDQVLDGAEDRGVVVQIELGRSDPYRVFDPEMGKDFWWPEEDLQEVPA